MGNKFLVLGYFHRDNLGDDVYYYIWDQYFKTYWPNSEYIIKNTDDVNTIPRDLTAIICGGGDLINDYFIKKINILTVEIKCPIYAVSVGIPYPKLVDCGYLSNFDYTIHRNKVDSEDLVGKLGSDRVQWAPDLAFLLPKMEQEVSTYLSQAQLISQTFPRLSRRGNKKIGIFLARPIFKASDPDSYQKIVRVLAEFIADIAVRKVKGKGLLYKCIKPSKNEFEVYLIPCSTHEKSTREDDRIIQNDVLAELSHMGNFPNIYYLTDPVPINQICDLFTQFHLTISTRFHPHIFSILAETPVMSIYCSRKVDNLMDELNLQEYTVKMPIHADTLHPIDLDRTELIDTFNRTVVNWSIYKQRLSQIRANLVTEADKLSQTINNLLYYTIRSFAPDNSRFPHRVTEIYAGVYANLVDYLFDGADTLIDSDKSVFQLVSESSKNPSAEFITELIVFAIFRRRNTPFNWGLSQQVLQPDFNLRDSVSYIVEHGMPTLVPHKELIANNLDMNLRKYNLYYFDQHKLEGYHRSGWNSVNKILSKFHNPCGMIFDAYLDQTFGWYKDFYTELGILPIKKPWMGVFHHTPISNYSENNLSSIFKDSVFLKSLSSCKGIVVLSEYLRRWVMGQLGDLGIYHVPVRMMYHPSEDNCPHFDMKLFLENPNKKIIQIGAWLRDSYAIYRLMTPSEYQKCALKGKGMDNYFAKDEYLDQIEKSLLEIGCDNAYQVQEICRPELSCNKYMTGLIQMIKENHNTVEIINRVDNDDYDTLLTKNLVFINLVDASAVNTIIECIVRNTPILVNRLAAVEEYLGKDYPLYYDNYVHALQLIEDLTKIYEAHYYLRQMDKSKFTLHFFQKKVLPKNFSI